MRFCDGEGTELHLTVSMFAKYEIAMNTQYTLTTPTYALRLLVFQSTSLCHQRPIFVNVNGSLSRFRRRNRLQTFSNTVPRY